MFPEHRELIAKLRQSDSHFKNLFDQHNDLDHRVKNIESGIANGSAEDLSRLKKDKLALKDDIYKIIKRKMGNGN
jgi:uncharacterized protein